MTKKKSGKQRADARSQARQKKRAPNVRGRSEVFRIVEDDVIVTTSRGVKVKCLGIADAITQQQVAIRGSFDWPEIPTRVMEDAAGVKIEEELTRDYVEKYGTEEQKEQWAQYEAAYGLVDAEFKEEFNEKWARLIAYKGIQVADAKLVEKWEREHEALGFTVPEDDIERAYHWFVTEIVGNVEEDSYAISLGIYRASGAEEEPLDQLEALFRVKVGSSDGGSDAGDGAEDTGAPGEKEEA